MQSRPTNPDAAPSSPPNPNFLQRLLGAEEAPREPVQALPADWDQRDLDQRVREIGEW